MSDILNSERTLVISCSPYITPYLKKEIESLGYKVESESWTTVETKGTFEDAFRLNLCLRTANHVFLLIKKFQAATLDNLYQETREVEWEEIIPTDGYFSVHTVSDHEEVKNFMFLNMKIKDAIADRFMAKLNKRPDSGAEKNRTVIFLHWKNNECSLYIDTSGESLSKHGYRKIAMKAPLQETLAAAMIFATRWDRQIPFVNPMCGSGTLAIEAALMAINKPPGLIRRNYGFMHVKTFDEEKYLLLKGELSSKVQPSSPAKIIATDKDKKALSAAKDNAKLAGVDELIQFINCEFDETPLPVEKGVIIFNPPYGERLGASLDLEKTYSDIGNFLKRKCAGYFGYVFTGSLELAKHIGLKPKMKKDFLNGQLQCKLLEFEMYEGSRRTVSQD